MMRNDKWWQFSVSTVSMSTASMSKRLAVLAVSALAAACGSGSTSEPAEDIEGGEDAVEDLATGSDVAGEDTPSDAQNDTVQADAEDAEPDVPPECKKNSECNDSDPCTDNICQSGKCTYPYNAGPCNDNDPCTQNDFCKQGVCKGTGTCTDAVDDTSPDTVGDTSGGDASGDTSGDTGSTGKCGQAEWQSTLNDAFIGKLGTCGQGCIQNPTKQCLSDCIQQSGSLSASCASCFGDLGECVANKCLTTCATGATSQGCKDCAAKNCGNALSTCSGFPAPNCAADGDCDDKSACTKDSCVNMFCQHTATTCDDGNGCTADSCDPAKGCQATALPASVTCDDGMVCTEGDNCGSGSCTGSEKNCDDLNACTADSCDPVSGCIHNPLSNTGCDDNNAATIADTCDAGVCKGAVPECLDVTQCDDALGCTDDSCEQATHTCKHAIAAGNCLIDGACYVDGAGDPSSTCLGCSASKSNNTWSVANESKACGSDGICASGTCFAPWPPADPLSNGKDCALPACDAQQIPAVYLGGNWTVTTKTVSTTCNEIIQLVEPRANVGYTKTGSVHPLNFVGGCDYAQGGTSLQVGTLVSNTEVTCEVSKDLTYGVTTVQTGVIAFANGKGTGTAVATLFDLPDIAGQPANSCEIVVQVTVQHVPDCQFDGDCDDLTDCTTDTCDTGICKHALAADTCLVDGICYATGAYKGPTGNASCRLCMGSFPSQYGWIILSSGEPCDDGDPGTTGETCGLGGKCVALPPP